MTTLGKYELYEEELGRFAVVYRALDKRLNCEVALKVLNASLSDDPRFVQQFLREAQTAANLKHPSIVVIHDADEASGRLYLAPAHTRLYVRETPASNLGALERRERRPPPANRHRGRQPGALGWRVYRSILTLGGMLVPVRQTDGRSVDWPYLI